MSSKSKPPTTKFFAEPVVITDNFHPKNQQLEPQTLKFIRYHQKIETFDDYIKTELGRKFVKVDAKYLSHNDPESSSHTDVPKQFWDDKKWDINFYKWVKDNPDKIARSTHNQERHKELSGKTVQQALASRMVDARDIRYDIAKGFMTLGA